MADIYHAENLVQHMGYVHLTSIFKVPHLETSYEHGFFLVSTSYEQSWRYQNNKYKNPFNREVGYLQRIALEFYVNHMEDYMDQNFHYMIK